jgi:hypothetical protein
MGAVLPLELTTVWTIPLQLGGGWTLKTIDTQ